MTPQELADEILPEVEEAYKDMVLVYASRLTREARERGSLVYQQSKLGDIRVIVPIPGKLLDGTSIDAVAEIVAQRDFVERAGQYHQNVIYDDEGNAVANFYQQDMIPLEVLCKPLRDVRLA